MIKIKVEKLSITCWYHEFIMKLKPIMFAFGAYATNQSTVGVVRQQYMLSSDYFLSLFSQF